MGSPRTSRAVSSSDSDERIRHDSGEGVDEDRIRVEGPRPADANPLFPRKLLGLDVEVEEDLEVVGDETDRTNQHVASARALDRLEQVGPKPWFARMTR